MPRALEFPGQLASGRMSNEGAAFFDLDRTLMAGSSGMHFARAAYGSGHGEAGASSCAGASSTCASGSGARPTSAPPQVLSQVKELLGGVPERDIERMAPDLLAGVLPRIYPQMLDEVRATRTPAGHVHRQRRRERAGRDAGPRAGHGGRDRHAVRGRRRRAADRADRRAVRVRRGQGRGDAGVRRRARRRPRRLVGLLGLGLRPADAARGRQAGRGQPGRRAGARSRPRRGGG